MSASRRRERRFGSDADPYDWGMDSPLEPDALSFSSQESMIMSRRSTRRRHRR